jgi:hypothetical protein
VESDILGSGLERSNMLSQYGTETRFSRYLLQGTPLQLSESRTDDDETKARQEEGKMLALKVTKFDSR